MNPLKKGELIELFIGLDKEILQSKDEDKVKEYLIPKNKAIIEYLNEFYPNMEGLEKLDPNDEKTLLFGLVFSIAEAKDNNNDQDKSLSLQLPGWVDCVMDIIGVTSIYGLLTGAATATYTTIMSIVFKIVKRYVGWIGIAYCLYEISQDCF